ncbi:MAG: ribonuclease HII [Desulfurococcaceae archaeon]
MNQEPQLGAGIIKMNEKMILHIGIDEAGRGPLIGDLVIAGVLVDDSTLEKLRLNGLAESKQLNSKSRNEFYKEAVRSKAVVIAVYIPPWRIDRENLNKLEEKYIVWIIGVLRRLLGENKNAEIKITIDEVKGSAKRIESFVREVFNGVKVDYRMEPGADAKYSSVALASIFAKVMRDLNLLALKKLFGDFGSGYSTDPLLLDWIKQNYKPEQNPPLFIRRSWRNLKNIAPKWYIEKKKGPWRHRSILDYAKR